VHEADNLTTFMCRLSRNSGASTSWNPKGLSRPVVGKLYLLHRVKDEKNILHKIKIGKIISMGHILGRNCLLKRVIEEKIEVIKLMGR
jgi:hypothetical protein